MSTSPGVTLVAIVVMSVGAPKAEETFPVPLAVPNDPGAVDVTFDVPLGRSDRPAVDATLLPFHTP